MKNTLLLVAALALAAGARAQTIQSAASPAARATPPTDRSAEQQAANQARRLATDIGLSAEQQTKVQQILLAARQQMQAAREQAQASGDSQNLRAGMKAARDQADARLRTVLTPAQFAKYQQLMAERIGQLRTRAGVSER